MGYREGRGLERQNISDFQGSKTIVNDTGTADAQTQHCALGKTHKN